ncbi:MAG: hypothetical protein OXJ56_03325 [Rhodospirillaceae bacterium]|nr:hypothetical protein [Rhodospirillaceae bacterium]
MRNRLLPLRRALQPKGGGMCGRQDNQPGSSDSDLVRLRHHPSVWLLPAGLLVAALLPWPYGYYNFLRIVVCTVTAWLAYTQWRHDDALSGWVVALGATSVLYNPFVPIYLTRELWSGLNLAGALVLAGHLRSLGRMTNNRNAVESVELQERSPDASSQQMSRTKGRTLKSSKRGTGWRREG